MSIPYRAVDKAPQILKIRANEYWVKFFSYPLKKAQQPYFRSLASLRHGTEMLHLQSVTIIL